MEKMDIDISPTPVISPPAPKSMVKVALTDGRLDVSAILLDGESVDKLIRALQANRALLPEVLLSPQDLNTRCWSRS